VYARFNRDGSPNDIYNALTITLESGALASIASTAATPLCERNYEVRIFGSKAILQLELWRGWMAMIDFADKRTGFEPLAETEIYPSQRPALNFVDSILEKPQTVRPGNLASPRWKSSKPPVNPRKQIAAKKFVKSKASAIKNPARTNLLRFASALESACPTHRHRVDHSRAFPPLVATAQRYEETHPEFASAGETHP